MSHQRGHGDDLMSIGEFAAAGGLSPKALRLYDELGLLPPARVDGSSGYRLYAVGQLEQARLVAAMRQLQIPLAEIKAILGLETVAAADRIAEYWAGAEKDHVARRELAAYLVSQLSGKGSTMFDVSTREMPDRSVLCLKRSVAGQDRAWSLGKEFVALLRRLALPRIEGQAGAVFCIYWGEVSDDSDGPIEWCRPVPDDQARALAAETPELELRTEPAHREALVQLGPGGQLAPAQWQLVSRSLRTWTEQHGAHPSDLGARVTFVASSPLTETSVPDCDFAVPLGDGDNR
jgi:DNA-binding transcriptional MerR regulator